MVLLGLLLISSCAKERYRRDRRNRLTKHAQKASDYLQNQAIELTQENIRNRSATEKKAIKRKNKQQAELNALNARSKIKNSKKHSGNFTLY